jgi:hypothetical protein
MMEAASTCKTSVDFYQTTRRKVPKDIHHHEVFLFSRRSQWRCCVIGGKAPRILSLVTRWSWVGSCTFLPLYPPGTLRIGNGDTCLYTAAREQCNVLLQKLQNSKRWENHRSHNRFSLIRERETDCALFGGCLLAPYSRGDRSGLQLSHSCPLYFWEICRCNFNSESDWFNASTSGEWNFFNGPVVYFFLMIDIRNQFCIYC